MIWVISMNRTEYRITGVVGNDDIPVMTEWMDIPNGEATGIDVGLKILGWHDTTIEKRETDE